MRSIVLLLLSCLSIVVSAQPLQGQLTQGGMVLGEVAPGSKVLLDEQEVKVAANGIFVIGFDRDAKAKALLTVIKPDGEKDEQILSIAQREYRIQRIEGIAKKIMSPSDEALKRIREEAAQVRAARAKVFDRLDFAGEFQWPLTGPVTGVFGSQRVYNGVPKRPHYGVDVAAPVGTVVTTPAPA